jgi:glyoxylase-like metal-dependent hydrolase (beta-lactamase superfamily II)
LPGAPNRFSGRQKAAPLSLTLADTESIPMQLDKDTTLIPGETNSLVWRHIVFDPSVASDLLASKKIETVYITHGHCDHFRLAATLRETGAKVVASR